MNLGLGEMIFIFFLALLIFGPRQLPRLGRQLGRAMAEFRRASNEFKAQLEDEIRQLDLDDTVGHTIAPPPRPQGSVSRRAQSPAVPAATQPAGGEPGGPGDAATDRGGETRSDA